MNLKELRKKIAQRFPNEYSKYMKEEPTMQIIKINYDKKNHNGLIIKILSKMRDYVLKAKESLMMRTASLLIIQNSNSRESGP